MNVVLVVPSISRVGGGVSEAARLLAQLLASRADTRVMVLTVHDEHYDEDIQDWAGVEVIASRRFGPTNYGISPGLLWQLLRVRADVAHVHGLWMFHCLAVLTWSILTARPYVVTPHGMLAPWIVARSTRLKRVVSWLYQDRFLRRAAAFHALTEKERGEINLWTTPRAVAIIPNFVRQQPLPETRPPWWSDDLEGKRVYLFLGRIHEKKGWRELVEAWDRLTEADTVTRNQAVLVFCGWMDGDDDLVRIIEERGPGRNNLRYVGPQFGANKLSSMRNAYAFVLPSKSEGLPMTVLEAWQVGAPVLMTAACNLPIGFERGAAVEIGQTTEAIVAGLRTAEAWKASQRAHLIHCGQRLIEEHFSPHVVGDRMIRLFQSAINSDARSRPAPSTWGAP